MTITTSPKIQVFQIQQEAFLFLGKDYAQKNADYEAIWNDFCNGGHDVMTGMCATTDPKVNLFD